MPRFSSISQKRLDSCDDRLKSLFTEVVKGYDCSIVCGHRSEEEQNKAYDEGFSKKRFPASKHNTFPSLAVDVMPFPVNYLDVDRLTAFANEVKRVAAELKIKVKWGGDWVNFVDMPHWELED